MNEFNVNWCGHTDQDLSGTYLSFEECMLKQEEYMQNCIEERNM